MIAAVEGGRAADRAECVKNPDELESRRDKALLLALKGKHSEAQAAVPRMMQKVRRDKAYCGRLIRRNNVA